LANGELAVGELAVGEIGSFHAALFSPPVGFFTTFSTFSPL
jgi:hypothetical protein